MGMPQLTPEQMTRLEQAARDAASERSRAKKEFIDLHGPALVDEAISEVAAALRIETSKDDWQIKLSSAEEQEPSMDALSASTVFNSLVHVSKRYGQPALLSYGKSLSPENFLYVMDAARKEANRAQW